MISGRIVLGFVLLFSTATSWAANKKPFKYQAEMAAKYTADAMNSLGTYEKFMMLVKIHVPKEQYESTWKVLTKNGVNKVDKLPRVRQDGKKVYFDKNSFIQFNDDETITLNGKVFQKSEKPLDVVMQDMMNTMPDEPPSASFSFFIPKAHAAYIPPTRLGGPAMGAMAMQRPMRPVGFDNFQPQPFHYPGSTFQSYNMFGPPMSQYNNFGCQNQGYRYMRGPPGQPIMGPRVDPYGMNFFMGGNTPSCNSASSGNFSGLLSMFMQFFGSLGNNQPQPDPYVNPNISI